MDNYTIIHLHSDLSNGVTNVDSVTKYTAYIKKAQECGMRALAFTEHGSVFSWLGKKEAIEDAGMKYIHGEEFYMTESLEKKIKDNYHVCLFARNWEGVKEINRLSSASFNREDGHYYYRPRITIDELENTSDNVIVTTACLASALHSGTATIKRRLIKFLAADRERCFLEIQHHNVPEQKEYNRYLLELAQKHGLRLIAGTDTHALNEAHMEARAVLQHAKGVRFENEDGWDLTFKTYDELVSAYRAQDALPYKVVLEAIQNTNVLANMVEPFEMDRSYKYPHLWENPEVELRRLVAEGIKRRGVDKYPNYQEYVNRAEYEMSVYKHNKAFDFILLMNEVAEYCRAHDIQLGYGRGSVNGSVVCWLLGITEMDSIKFKLNFERFMNVERVSLADIDSDIPPNRRDDVINYIFNRRGLYCSEIITFNTIALKGAIRDVCKGLYCDNDDVDYMKLDDEIGKMAEKDEDGARKKYPDVFKYVDIANGVVISLGVHPSGRLVVDHPFDGEVGLCSSSTNTHAISQLWMHELDSLNYVKLDLLALDTIELISGTCKLANIPMLLPDNMDVNDDKVWKSMRDDTTCIFQWESDTAQDYIKKLLSDSTIEKFKAVNPNVDRMELITIGNSAIRPAGASYRDDLANGVIRRTGNPAIDKFLSSTFGYLVYQCQIIEFLHTYCGFTMGQADIVRRGFAKKTGTDQYIPIIKDGGYMPQDKNHEKHIDGFIKTMSEKFDMSREQAEHDIVAFIQVIEDASRYLFSRNHSAPYSYEGYAAAWLRYYYPLEFLTTALNITTDKPEKQAALLKYAHKTGIKIQLPTFRYSRGAYYFDKETNSIYKGTGSLPMLNNQVSDELYDLRDRRFNTFTDLLYNLPQDIRTNQVDTLIKIDYFAEFGDSAKLLTVYKWYQRLRKIGNISCDEVPDKYKEIFARHCDHMTENRVEEIDVEQYAEDRGYESDLPKLELKPDKDGNRRYSTKQAIKLWDLSADEIEQYAARRVKGRYCEIDTRRILREIEAAEADVKTNEIQRARWQYDILGYTNIINKNMNWRVIQVHNIDTKYTPQFDGYSFATGKTVHFRVRKTATNNPHSRYCGFCGYDRNKLEDGDIIYMYTAKKLPRQECVDREHNKWRDTDEIQWWAAKYSVLGDDIDETLLYSK